VLAGGLEAVGEEGFGGGVVLGDGGGGHCGWMFSFILVWLTEIGVWLIRFALSWESFPVFCISLLLQL
jgi:hypothetical protein